VKRRMETQDGVTLIAPGQHVMIAWMRLFFAPYGVA
jgi:hypothetical protein